MQVITLGKGEGFAGEAGEALTQGVEPSLDMIGFALLLVHHAMTMHVKNVGVGQPAVTEGGAVDICVGNASPELQCPNFGAVSEPVGDHLPSAATQG